MATAALNQTDHGQLADSAELYEIVNGMRREVSPMGAWAGVVASLLAHSLNSFARQRKLGLAVVEVLFRLKHNQRRPDLAFVALDRWPLAAVPTEDPPALDVAPNLAVEIVSQNNSAAEVFLKTQEYFESGVQLVWVVYPLQRCIQVFESAEQSRILHEEDELDGGRVLPGFRLQLSELFAVVPKGQ
jgi:Uma2 family endonuclease